MTEHIDVGVLSELQEIMEDNYHVLLDTFLDDSPRRLDSLHEAKNPDELGRVAHSLKGSSNNMGAFRLGELCGQLEERARQPPLLGIEDLINQIDREYQEVRKLLEAERTRVIPTS